MTMMLQGSDSTVRIEVLGEELRRLREASGLTLSEVVARIGISESHLCRFENGRRVPSAEDVSALLVIYGVTGEDRHELLALAKKAGQPGLWQRDGSSESRFATLKLLESSLVSIIGEGALRCPIGGREVLRDQLRYLVEAAERSNITLRIVPAMVAGHPGLLGSFLRMRFADRPSVVFLQHHNSSLFLEAHHEVNVYDEAIVELLSVAMTEEDSLRLVAEMATNLE
jgi:transcriptional regulator with XRE-family HTH domain